MERRRMHAQIATKPPQKWIERIDTASTVGPPLESSTPRTPRTIAKYFVEENHRRWSARHHGAVIMSIREVAALFGNDDIKGVEAAVRELESTSMADVCRNAVDKELIHPLRSRLDQPDPMSLASRGGHGPARLISWRMRGAQTQIGKGGPAHNPQPAHRPLLYGSVGSDQRTGMPGESVLGRSRGNGYRLFNSLYNQVDAEQSHRTRGAPFASYCQRKHTRRLCPVASTPTPACVFQTNMLKTGITKSPARFSATPAGTGSAETGSTGREVLSPMDQRSALRRAHSTEPGAPGNMGKLKGFHNTREAMPGPLWFNGGTRGALHLPVGSFTSDAPFYASQQVKYRPK